jgi:eukaryotic-like serine/threonine-protein kinase
MNPTRWQQIDELFDAALDLPESEREVFLSAKCNGDDELKKEVLSLLESQKSSDNFLEKSAMGIAARNLADEQTEIAETYFPGRTIGTYKIESLLGSGGMGEVYLAYDEKLRRNVALKILPAEYTTSDERVKRFQLEARAISALNHPNIVTIYDVGTLDGINYIATEYVEGKTFREVIGSGLKLKEILAVSIQICEALSAAHNAGIIHRDIKPENIILRPDGYVKILDFGLAKLSEVDLNTLRNFNATAKGVIIGTPAYMSPEQIADDKVDHRTDLWSVGVVLYELLTGVNPFKKTNRQTTFQAVLSEEPPPPSSVNPDISPEIDRILLKALEKDADLSYQTASDLRADLKRIKREIDSSPSWNSVSAQHLKSTAAQRNYLAFALGAILLLLMAFGGWYLFFSGDSTEAKQAVEWKNAKNIQLTASSGLYGYPSLSPDGNSFVYAYFDGKNRDIYLQRIGGKTQIKLTKDSDENSTMPVFSPDGKYIAFRSERGSRGIFVMEETGENPRRISDIGFHPSWSPDGTKIVVSDRAAAVHTAHSTPNSLLWVIDVKTGEKQRLETKGDAIMPSWSPDGSRIAFWYISSQGALGNIATIPATGGDPVIVTDDPKSDWNPVWSPDGKYLYFSSNRKGNMNLWRVAIDQKTGKTTGEPESVSAPTKYCRHITFSRDGKRLAYVRYESKSNLQTLPFDEKTGKVGSEIGWLAQGNREISHPELSPVGERFVLRTLNETQEDLAILSRDGSNERFLVEDKFNDRNPHWSPDGKRLAFQTDRTGKYQIWTINADGSEATQITFSEKIGASNPVWSPDGNKIIFGEIGEKYETPHILDLTKPWAEQTLEKIPPPPDFNASYAARDWSSDGQKLLVSFYEADGDEQGIGVYNFQSKTYEKITDEGAYPNWLADNRRFIFNKDEKIFIADSVTKKITLLYSPPSYQIQQPNISPDNKLIYYRYLQIDADIWLIDATENQ